MHRASLRIGIIVLATALAACTTTGTGIGEFQDGGPDVRFHWTAESPAKGQITATYSDGTKYSGRYFQITSETRVDDVQPLWVDWGGWSGPWDEWPYWDAGPEFITHYTGRVVANLSDPSGSRMRCNFRLIQPSRGLSGGGQGKCQLGSGEAIHAQFPEV